MKISPKKPHPSELQITLADFLESYNNNIPDSFPKATIALLQQYKNEHEALFKHGESWSLDIHRKKIMDWLPQNMKNI